MPRRITVNSRGGVLSGRRTKVVPVDNKANAQDSLTVPKRAIDQDIHEVASTAVGRTDTLRSRVGNVSLVPDCPNRRRTQAATAQASSEPDGPIRF